MANSTNEDNSSNSQGTDDGESTEGSDDILSSIKNLDSVSEVYFCANDVYTNNKGILNLFRYYRYDDTQWNVSLFSDASPFANYLNKKSVVKKIWYLCLVLIIVQFSIEIFFGLEILIYDINASIIRLLLVLIVLVLPLYFIDYKKNKVDKKSYLIFTIITAVFILLLYVLCFSSNKYFYFNSPYENSKRVLIVNETSTLGSGTGYFYERKNIIFIKRINQSINYDVSPFSHGAATIKWLDENSVQIDYVNNSVGHHNTEIIKLD